MKEFKGTQGKWYVQEYSDAYTNIIRCDNGKGFTSIYIASTSQNPAPETRADAQLIATAPELLESLQEMVFLFNNENIDQQNAKVKAVLAINKALGL